MDGPLVEDGLGQLQPHPWFSQHGRLRACRTRLMPGTALSSNPHQVARPSRKCSLLFRQHPRANQAGHMRLTGTNVVAEAWAITK